MGRVEGKVAFVTGAARGQGRAHCVRLAAEGADIIAVDACTQVDTVPYELATPEDLAETERLVSATGRGVVARRADVRDVPGLEAAVAEGLAAFGKIDVVVANAGVFAGGSALSVGARVWADVLDINLIGTWNTIRAALPSMIERDAGGSIVITSSSNGGLKAPPNFGAYAASKHGLNGLMKSLALELAPHWIRVNTVHPTAVNTGMIMNQFTYDLFRPDMDSPCAEDCRDIFTSFHALPIPWVQPEDVSNAVLFLASDEARYITGIHLPVDGGLSQK